MLQFLVLCIIFLPYPVWMLIREILFLRRTRNCTVQVEGKIVRLEEKIPIMRRGRSEFMAEVSYTYNGTAYTAMAFQRFRYSDYCADQIVNVYVNPDEPACFVLGTERGTAGTNILLGLLVLFVLLIALAVLNAEITDSRRQQDAMNAVVSEMEEKLLAGDEDVPEDLIRDQGSRAVSGTEVQ